MRVRELRESDIPRLREIYAAQGFAYEFPDLLSAEFENVQVVVDGRDEPVAAAAAKRTIELYLFMGRPARPHEGMHWVRILHDSLRQSLRAKGYSEANAFLPPQIEKPFGRRLMRSFGWAKNWASYCVRV